MHSCRPICILFLYTKKGKNMFVQKDVYKMSCHIITLFVY